MNVEKQHIFVNILLCIIFINIPGLSYGAVTVTRPGGSDDDCERLCREEAEIDCKYYKHSSVKGICTLTTEPDPTINDLKRLEEPDRKTAESWVSQLQARILALEQRDTDTKNMHKDISDLRVEIEALKNGRALTHHLLRSNKEQTDQNLAAIDDKVEVAQGEIKRAEDTILSLGDMQKTLGNKLRQLNEDSKATSLTVTMLSQASKDMHGSMREIGYSLAEMRTTISDLKKSITDLQVRFAGLSTDVMEKVATVDTMVGPELKELKLSQTTLAQALALLTKKIMAISPRIPELQKRLSSKDGKFTVIDMQLQSLSRQLAFVTERASFSESQIKHAIDPSSRINVERRQILMRIQGQVESLASAQTRMQNDLLAEISDRSRIYKEFSTLRLERKSIVDQIINQEDDVRDLKRAVRVLMTDEPKSKLLSNILTRQLAILRTVKRMRDRQDASRTNLVKYKTKIEINQQEMLRRIVIRKATDQALITMLTKLFDAYHRIRLHIQRDNSKMVIRKLMRQYNQAAKKINTARRRQQSVIEAVVQNRWIIQNARRVLVAQKEQRDKAMFQLASVKKQTTKLFKMVITDKMRREALNQPTVFKRLNKVSDAQAEILEVLSQYRLDIQRTQAEIVAQRRQQMQEAWRSANLRKQLRTLHQSVEALLTREHTRNMMIGDIHSAVSDQIMQQATLNELKNQRLANVVDLTHGIRILPSRHLDEYHEPPSTNEIRYAVADELGKLIREKNARNRHLTNVAELKRRILAGGKKKRRRRKKTKKRGAAADEGNNQDINNDFLSDIHNTVTGQLEQQARTNAMNNMHLANVADLHQRIRVLKDRPGEMSHSDVLDEIHNVVTDELEQQATQKVLSGDVAELDKGMRLLINHRIENERLKRT